MACVFPDEDFMGIRKEFESLIKYELGYWVRKLEPIYQIGKEAHAKVTAIFSW